MPFHTWSPRFALVAFVTCATVLATAVSQDNPQDPPAPARTVVTRITGASREAEPMILDGLRWLARSQDENGSWSPASLIARCPSDAPTYRPDPPYGHELDEGATGLALLCFLRAGFAPGAAFDLDDPVTEKRHDLGGIVKRGLTWLKEKQTTEGSFCAQRKFTHCEAVAGLAVIEAYARTKDEAWKETAQRSLMFIARAQRPSPNGSGLWGWRPATLQDAERFSRGLPKEEASRRIHEADTPVTQCCALMLRAGRLAGLDVPDSSLAGAAAFTQWVTSENGMVGYLDPKDAGATIPGIDDYFTSHPAVMSALGMHTRVLTQKNPDVKFLELAASQVMKDVPIVSKDKLSIDYYYWHQGTAALRACAGTTGSKSATNWKTWQRALFDALATTQDRTPKDCANGGWVLPDRWSRESGPVYATAINVLTLLETIRAKP
jgi:hypothetical protein